MCGRAHGVEWGVTGPLEWMACLGGMGSCRGMTGVLLLRAEASREAENNPVLPIVWVADSIWVCTKGSAASRQQKTRVDM